LLASILHWIFDIRSHTAQAALIAAFCLLAGHNSASHHDHSNHSWLAATAGLMAGCAVTLPWLTFSGAISN
ncbi:MAG: ABC transporter permease, partial [Mariprofundales bacterium]|nr:ABC transporter permease [Mariprofundales bacterium]